MNASDHRPRVNAERRARMRRRLLESAVLVFAEKGLEASQIDDVMKVAQVSRGGFYGHFRSMAELLAAIGEELGNETLYVIESRVWNTTDPAERVANGMRLYLRVAQDHPPFARFIAAAGLNVSSPNNLIHEYLPPHIAEGVASGHFADIGIDAAIDLIAGTMLTAVVRIARGEADTSYGQRAVVGILQGLGVPAERARALVSLTLAPLALPEDSLLWRASLRARHPNKAAPAH